MNNKKIYLLFSLVFAAFLFGQTKAPRVLVYSDHEPFGNMRTRFLKEVFFSNIRKESKGRIMVEPHWQGELFISYDALKNVAAQNRMDITVVVPEYAPKNLPLHLMFKGFPTGPSGAAQVAFFREVFKNNPEFREELTKNNVINIMTMGIYPSAFFSNKQIDFPGSLKGQKWRLASFFHKDFMQNLGAEAVSMPWDQKITEAFNKNSLDGILVNLDGSEEFGIKNAAPNILTSQQLWMGHVYLIVMNRDTWNTLTKKDQKAIQRAAKISYQLLGTTLDTGYREMFERNKKSGLNIREMTAAELSAWQNAAKFEAAQDNWLQSLPVGLQPEASKVLNRVRLSIKQQ